MNGPNDFLQLIQSCRQRDPAAIAQLVQRYLPYVRAAVRRRLSSILRLRFDSMDFTQDVWHSFFRNALDDRQLLSEKHLIAYLSSMARNKVMEEYRHQMRQKTGLMRNVNNLSMADFPGREPTPSTGAMVDDEWERLTAGLSKRHRAMLAKLRQGNSYKDIAAEFGLSEKTLQRLVGRLFAREASPESNSHDSDC